MKRLRKQATTTINASTSVSSRIKNIGKLTVVFASIVSLVRPFNIKNVILIRNQLTLVWHAVRAVPRSSHVVSLGVCQQVETRACGDEYWCDADAAEVNLVPVVLWLTLRMDEADSVLVRVVLVYFPTDIESLVVASVRGEQSPPKESNIYFWDEHDSIVIACSHKHVICFYDCFESDEPRGLLIHYRLAHNREQLHVRHVDLLERLLVWFNYHLSERHYFSVDIRATKPQVP